VYRLRGWNNYGAHRGDVDGDGVSNNKEIIPVLFIMSGQPQYPPPNLNMLNSFERLRAYFEAEVGTGLYLYGHRDLMATACPGDNIYAYVKTHRKSTDEPPVPVLEDDDMLEVGDRGAAVARLQGLINGVGYEPKLVEDGIFGPKTLGGVRWAHSKYELPVRDGADGLLMFFLQSDDARLASISAEAFAANKNARAALLEAQRAHKRLNGVKDVL
jgi:hypothetical protein